MQQNVDLELNTEVCSSNTEAREPYDYKPTQYTPEGKMTWKTINLSAF